MRNTREAAARGTGLAATGAGGAVPYDEKTFFESFYRANVSGTPQDHMTIGAVSEPEARFHYNATENSIIRALLSLSPPPPPGMLAAWNLLRRRRGARLLDVGSGTGHWIDFMRQLFHVTEAVGVEITEQMCAFLREKYGPGGGVTVLQADVAADGFGAEAVGGAVDYVTAVGVMFHVVDDARWRRAVANLAAALRPGGLMIVGDDFGVETRDVQFHATDEFASWREFDAAKAAEGAARVNKRVRSLADWQAAAGACGLQMVALVRTDRDPRITTPENDVLVLRRAAEGEGRP
ncbi:MAG TPA: class I SAM-dependent methyltransferase [Longimicrobium sp.]|nr:class I SAM-dependent methyltransferase [Longimicrobium sp.]